MINSYQIILDGQEAGPYTQRELMDMEIDADTLVLSPLAKDWQYAVDLPEFRGYFESIGIYAPTQANMAGFWWRLVAYIIDYIIQIILLLVLFTIIAVIVVAAGGTINIDILTSTKMNDRLLTNLIGAAFNILYHSICESTRLRGSFGKLALRISVVDANGQKLRFTQAFSRNLGKMGSSLVFGIGFLSVLWNDHRQAWHDQWSKSYVIRREV